MSNDNYLQYAKSRTSLTISCEPEFVYIKTLVHSITARVNLFLYVQILCIVRLSCTRKRMIIDTINMRSLSHKCSFSAVVL